MMKLHKKFGRRGIALLAAMMFIVIFASVSIGFLALSSANAQIAQNHHLGNAAFCSAQSGHDIIRYLINGIQIAESDPAQRMSAIYTQLQNRIAAAGMTCIAAQYDSSTDIISISDVSLADGGQKNFSVELWQNDSSDNTISVRITGQNGQISRNISVNYTLQERGHSVFDFGIATQGPLQMSGQTSISGVNLAVESDVFIDTMTAGDSFTISNKASVEGEVHIVNPYASYSIGSDSSVGGETGTAAEDHIHLGVDSVDFPVPDVEHFRQYATGPYVDQYTNLSSYVSLDNATIAAGTNPTFAGDMQIKGVLFIEQPNTVTFTGKATITGIIVGNSLPGTITSENNIQFSSQVSCLDVSTLEGEQFAAIRNEIGTFLIAPGFHADFTGQANIIHGVIAAAGIRFSGQAGGVINGSIINYASLPVVLEGQSELQFNRSGSAHNPAGFAPVRTLIVDVASYSEL
jgi:hypothetical protein